MIKNPFSKQKYMHIKNFSVYRGFLSYNPGAISLDFPGHEAAKGAEESAIN